MVLSMCDEISHCYSTDKAYRGMHLRQFGNVVSGVYSPVRAKHSKYFSLEETSIEGDLEVPRHLARRVHELLFQPPARGVRAPNHVEPVEPVEPVHLGIQRTRVDSTIPCNGEAGRIS